jgi:hypothetical protein
MPNDMVNKAATLLVTASMLVVSACCKEETLNKVDSPDKSFSAVLSIRDCGATTVEYTGLTLKSNRSWFGSEEAIFATKYDHGVELRWKNNSELVVYCPGCKAEEVSLQKTKFQTVSVDYKFGVAGLDY